MSDSQKQGRGASADPVAFRRIASGHYETVRYLLWRIPDVYPPAWNVEDRETYQLLVDGAATKADAIALLEKGSSE